MNNPLLETDIPPFPNGYEDYEIVPLNKLHSHIIKYSFKIYK